MHLCIERNNRAGEPSASSISIRHGTLRSVNSELQSCMSMSCGLIAPPRARKSKSTSHLYQPRAKSHMNAACFCFAWTSRCYCYCVLAYARCHAGACPCGLRFAWRCVSRAPRACAPRAHEPHVAWLAGTNFARLLSPTRFSRRTCRHTFAASCRESIRTAKLRRRFVWC